MLLNQLGGGKMRICRLEPPECAWTHVVGRQGQVGLPGVGDAQRLKAGEARPVAAAFVQAYNLTHLWTHLHSHDDYLLKNM